MCDGGVVGGGGGVNQPLNNLPSHHRYKSPKQFSESHTWRLVS